jgi:hypothetical protein
LQENVNDDPSPITDDAERTLYNLRFNKTGGVPLVEEWELLWRLRGLTVWNLAGRNSRLKTWSYGFLIIFPRTSPLMHAQMITRQSDTERF